MADSSLEFNSSSQFGLRYLSPLFRTSNFHVKYDNLLLVCLRDSNLPTPTDFLTAGF